VSKQLCNLGIDLGTSSVKAILFSENGVALARASAEWKPLDAQAGRSEAEPEDWWAAVVEAVRGLDSAGVEICGIGLSVLYPALVLFDRHNQPVRPAILYNDLRAAAESAELQNAYGESKARAITGNWFPAGSTTITSLLWLTRHESQSVERTAHVGHAATYLVQRLTGKLAIDYSNASLSGFYDVAENQWSAELCDYVKLTPGMLPEPMAGGTQAGKLTKEAAQALGLTAGIPVAAGAGDTVCSALGVGVKPEGELFVSCGSTNCFAALSQTPEFNNNLVNTSHLDTDTWINIGSTNVSGAAIQWFVEKFTGGDYQKFFEICSQAEAGCGGLVCLPSLAGERTPHYDPHARAVFFGAATTSTVVEFARSVAEGVCFADRQIVEVFERGARKINRIIATGGGSRDGFMRKLRADILGVEIAYSSVADASALGAALLGGIASGCYRDWQHAATVARAANERTPLKPDVAVHRAYDTPYLIFKQIYPRMKDLFRILA